MGSCYSITETQQLVVQTLTTEEVFNGPNSLTYISPLKTGNTHSLVLTYNVLNICLFLRDQEGCTYPHRKTVCSSQKHKGWKHSGVEGPW
jgi:hypothetical protein